MNIKVKTCLLAGLGVLFAGASAYAETLTWTGGAQGQFSSASNWSPSQQPQSGDTVVFESDVTLNSESFDFGSGGLIISVASGKTATFNISFQGKGGIVKNGAGTVHLEADSSYSGNTVINEGVVQMAKERSLGMGSVKLQRQADKSCQLYPSGQFTIWNWIEISGPYTAGKHTLYLNGAVALSGEISASDDFSIFSVWSHIPVYIHGAIHAHGHKVYLVPNPATADAAISLNANVDASIDKAGGNGSGTQAPFNLINTATLTDPEAEFVLRGGTGTIGANASILCRTVSVDGQYAVLKLDANTTLSSEAEVFVCNGGKLNANYTGTMCVSRLVVGGNDLPKGTYTKDNESSITGTGAIEVTGAVFRWIGSAQGDWNEPGNWSVGRVPTGGDKVSVSGDVTIIAGAQPINLGSGVLNLSCSRTLTVKATLTGEGTLMKGGAGTLDLSAANSYLGGTVITDGIVKTRVAGSLGTGAVELRRSAGGTCQLYPDSNFTVTNPINITGPFTAGKDTLYLNNGTVLAGPITAEDDFRVFNVWATATISGSVAAHGHKFILVQNPGTEQAGFTVNGTVDASIEKTAGDNQWHQSGVTLGASFALTDPESAFIVHGGTMTVNAKATIASKTVLVDGWSTLLLTAAGNLSDSASVTVNGSNAKIAVAKDVNVKIGELWKGTVRIPNGNYTKSKLPEICSGDGYLKVGEIGLTIIFR